MERPHRPTIHDVARHAGVSKSLVSLVLRGAPNVSDTRRQAVLAAMDALGYRANSLARGLVEQRTRIIGVMASDLHNPFFVELIAGILEEADALGYRTLLGTGRRAQVGEEAVIESLLGLPVDGVILLSPVVDLESLAVASRSAPTVVTGRADIAADAIDTVVVDDVAGAILAVEHLASLGHHHIAHVTGGDARGAAERRRGYERAMVNLGLSRFVQVVPGRFTDEAGYRAAHLALGNEPRPTAIFAANDLAALGALAAIEEAGLAVPQDISLVGYDNTQLSGLQHISLTSIDQLGFEMGRLAVNALDERVSQGRLESRRDVLKPRLVQRRTTAPPGA